MTLCTCASQKSFEHLEHMRALQHKHALGNTYRCIAATCKQLGVAEDSCDTNATKALCLHTSSSLQVSDILTTVACPLAQIAPPRSPAECPANLTLPEIVSVELSLT